MKRFLLATISLTALAASSASAADLPSVKATPAAPVPMWTGFYAGLNSGFNFGTNGNSVASSWGPVPSRFIFQGGVVGILPLSGVGLSQSGIITNNQNGFIGGFQAGYNYQFKDKFVLGLEADIQGTNISGSGNSFGYGYNQSSSNNGSVTSVGSVQLSSGVDWLGTVRGRAGYLLTPSFLVFGTAGLTYGGAHATVTNRALAAYELIPILRGSNQGNQQFYGTSSQSQTLVGWNAGAGAEWMLSQNWSVKAEAIYWNLGNMNLATTSVSSITGSNNITNGLVNNLGIRGSASAGNTNINYQGIIARAGINYHFSALLNAFSSSPFFVEKTSTKDISEVGVSRDWKGFYAGLNSGYSFGTNGNSVASSWGPQSFSGYDDSGDIVLPLSGVGLSQSGNITNNQNAFIGGFQAGYNYQFKDKYVLGLEADIQGANISGSGNRYGYGYNQSQQNTESANTIGSVQLSSGVDWLGTVRGRAGYLLTPSFLVFGTAGLTYGGVHANVTNRALTVYGEIPAVTEFVGAQSYYGASSQSQTLVGWNAGAGAEWMLSQNWSVKAEAIYWNLGNMNLVSYSFSANSGSGYWSPTNSLFTYIPASATAGNSSVNYQGVIARAGVNYHFDFGKSAPVAAKF